MTFNHGVTGSIPVWLPIEIKNARVAKLVYALDLGSSVFDMWVRVPPFAPFFINNFRKYIDKQYIPDITV